MKKLIISILTVMTAFIIAVAPVYAAEKCTLTSVLGTDKCDKDGNKVDSNSTKETKDGNKVDSNSTKETYNCSCDEDGSSIYDLLRLILNIMTIGIGILGIIGITIVGIQYLTAGGNEEQTRKAKQRLIEIVIGLVAYVALYALLYWLLPNYDESVDKLRQESATSSETTISLNQ